MYGHYEYTSTILVDCDFFFTFIFRFKQTYKVC